MARRRTRQSRFGGYGGFAPYVPVAERRRKAEVQAGKLAKKGQALAPVQSSLRKIAASWWGQAWCRNLERYSDYANRLGRGRSYLSHGAVIDLQIESGAVRAQVMGSSLYSVVVSIRPLEPARWEALVDSTAGQFNSLVDLLAGRFSDEMMTALTQPGSGLFPAPGEIGLRCSCPDWASMCKHIAAVLYGVGVRLDGEPALLFRLRNVAEDDLLVTAASAGSYIKAGEGARLDLGDGALGALFGIEFSSGEPPAPPPGKVRKAAVPPKSAANRKVTGAVVEKKSVQPPKRTASRLKVKAAPVVQVTKKPAVTKKPVATKKLVVTKKPVVIKKPSKTKPAAKTAAAKDGPVAKPNRVAKATPGGLPHKTKTVLPSPKKAVRRANGRRPKEGQKKS